MDTRAMTTIAAQDTIRNPAIGDVVTFVETAEETGFTVVDVELAPKSSNALHIHRAFDEHFEAVAGQLTVRVDGRTYRLEPGAGAVAPAGSVHGFANETESSIRFRVRLTPGHTGFEQGLRIAYGLAEDGLVRKGGVPRSLTHIALLTTMGDTQVAGPLRLAAPLFERLARRARARGVEQQLIDRYCR
jgi:quercetin dioxygenase-like cupin family protein